MTKRIVLSLVFVPVICVAGAGSPQPNRSAATQAQNDDRVQLPQADVPSGRQMYVQEILRG